MNERRPVRACLNADGSQKYTYYTRDAAKRAAREVRKKGQGKALRAYKCGSCIGYHVGNLPPHLA